MGIRTWGYRRRRAPLIQCGPMFEILRSIPWFAWIAIIAILSSAAVSVFKGIHRHEERMEMIKQGMDPSKIDDKKN